MVFNKVLWVPYVQGKGKGKGAGFKSWSQAGSHNFTKVKDSSRLVVGRVSKNATAW